MTWHAHKLRPHRAGNLAVLRALVASRFDDRGER
jgi:hypothetical protein